METAFSRRNFVVGGACAVAEATSSFAWGRPSKTFAYVSSWTAGPNGTGGGGGIHVFALNERGDSLQHLSSVEPELNAGYICISPDGRFLYATDERKDFGGKAGAGGGVVSFAIDTQDGSLKRINSQASMGAYPAYICIDGTGSRVIAANHGSYDTISRLERSQDGLRIENLYDDATVSMFSALPSGALDAACDVVNLERGHALNWENEKGLDSVFQASPHAHSVNFDPSNRFVIVCDKGGGSYLHLQVDTESAHWKKRRYLQLLRALHHATRLFIPGCLTFSSLMS